MKPTDTSQPLLSVIVPVYNVERWLDRCVVSIVGQTYRHLEIILVDDGSADRSGEICRKWAQNDSRIKIISQSNQGASAARNAGIAASSGEYIAFVDSDDYLGEEMYQTLMEKATGREADIVSCGLMRQDANGGFSEIIDFAEEKEFCGKEEMRELAGRYLMAPGRRDLNAGAWHAVYRRTVVGAGFLSERIYLPEDLIFQIETSLKANRFVYIPKAMYNYTYNASGVSKAISVDRIDTYLAAADKIKKILEQNGMNGLTEKYIFMKVYYFLRDLYADRNLSGKQKRAGIRRVLTDRRYRDMIAGADIRFGSGLKNRFRQLAFTLQRRGAFHLYHLYCLTDKILK